MNAKRTLLTSALIGGLAVGSYFLLKNNDAQTVVPTNDKPAVVQTVEDNGVNTREYLSQKLAEIQGKGMDFIVPDAVAENALKRFLDNKSGYPISTPRALSSARHAALDEVVKPGFGTDNAYWEASYSAWSEGLSWAGRLEGTGLQLDDIKDMPALYDRVLTIGKDAVSNPTTLMTFLKGKEDVVRNVLGEYAQTPEGQTRLTEVSEYLGTVQKALEATGNTDFRETHGKYLKSVDAWVSSYKAENAAQEKMYALAQELIEKLPEGDLKKQIEGRTGWSYGNNTKKEITASAPEDEGLRAVFDEYRAIEKQWHEIGVTGDKAFDTMQDLESSLHKQTDDYHTSMFAMRRFGQGGESAIKGLEEATTFARNLVTEYAQK